MAVSQFPIQVGITDVPHHQSAFNFNVPPVSVASSFLLCTDVQSLSSLLVDSALVLRGTSLVLTSRRV